MHQRTALRWVQPEMSGMQRAFGGVRAESGLGSAGPDS
jgi:hypothetical protein